MTAVPERRLDREWSNAFNRIEVQAGAKYVLSVQRECIPIVLVPGIMGTRLRAATERRAIWDPDSILSMIKKYGGFWLGAQARQRNLFGGGLLYQKGSAIPFEDDPDHNPSIDEAHAGASRRGWGGVAWMTYAPILVALEQARWGAFLGRCFDLPVYACGYDWRGSVADAGARLAARVRRIKRERGRTCNQVILVTHSMGGLVARSACKRDGLEGDVLGVVHTVQPATGAPAAYWRMKGGFERHGPVDLASMIIGTDGREVTSFMGRMPGGVQLLPNKRYRDNDGQAGWLRFFDEAGGERRLPDRGNPYTEIYRNKDDEWRLIRWPEYLIGRGRGDATPEQIKDALAAFNAFATEAEEFHDDLGDYQHPLSHHLYGTGGATADKVVLRKKSRTVPGWAYIAGERGRSVHDRGELDEVTADASMHMDPPRGDGDGTVPRSSAAFLVTAKGAGRVMFGGKDFEQTGTAAQAYEHAKVFAHGPLATQTIVRAIKALCTYKLDRELVAQDDGPR
jgi:hypothetical protein